MKVELPPPRILWSKMLKVCSSADLEFLRCQMLIQLAVEDAGKFTHTDDECAEFLGRIKLELRRRKQTRGEPSRVMEMTQAAANAIPPST